MGIIDQKLAERNAYYNQLVQIVRKKPPYRMRLALFFLTIGNNKTGKEYDFDGTFLFVYVIWKLNELWVLFDVNNPSFRSRLGEIDENALKQHMPNWSGKELFDILKGLQRVDGREIVAGFASDIGRPTIIDAFDSNDIKEFVSEIKQVESDDLKKFMSRVNVLYKGQDYMDALSENVEKNERGFDTIIDSIKSIFHGRGDKTPDALPTELEHMSPEEQSSIQDEVLTPLLEEAGLDVFLDNPFVDFYKKLGQYTRGFHDTKTFVPTETALRMLEYYLQEYYNNYNILKPQEHEAVQKVIGQKRFSELIKPIKEKCQAQFDYKNKQANKKVTKENIIQMPPMLNTEAAKNMFEAFVNAGILTPQYDGRYVFNLKKKRQLVYFIVEANNHLNLRINGYTQWRPFLDIILFEGESIDDLTSDYNKMVKDGRETPKGHKQIDDVFETLKK